MFFIINPFYKKGVLTFCICRIRMVSKRKLDLIDLLNNDMNILVDKGGYRIETA